MREITSHKVDGQAADVRVFATDAAGAGGANHQYLIQSAKDGTPLTAIIFQNGPVGEAGVNGITNEALLAIVEDRLQGFQTGKYACGDNAHALWRTRQAIKRLQRRTKKRMSRGVEGTSTV